MLLMDPSAGCTSVARGSLVHHAAPVGVFEILGKSGEACMHCQALSVVRSPGCVLSFYICTAAAQVDRKRRFWTNMLGGAAFLQDADLS